MKSITFKVKDELFIKLSELAEQNSLTISAQIRLILLDYLKKKINQPLMRDN